MKNSTCSVLNCGRDAARREWCHNHYRRWRVYGDPLGTPEPKGVVLCQEEGCEGRRLAKGLCHKHYERLRRNGSLDYVKAPVDRSGDTDSNKLCSACDELLPRDDFWVYSNATAVGDGLRSRCKSCEYAAARRTRDKLAEASYLRDRRSRPEVQVRQQEWYKAYYAENRDSYSRASHKRRSLIRDSYVDAGITVSALRARHGSDCVFCHSPMEFKPKRKRDPLLATLEHLTPLSRGGDHSWENCRLACLACNMSKNNKTQSEFVRWLDTRGPLVDSSSGSKSGRPAAAH